MKNIRNVQMLIWLISGNLISMAIGQTMIASTTSATQSTSASSTSSATDLQNTAQTPASAINPVSASTSMSQVPSNTVAKDTNTVPNVRYQFQVDLGKSKSDECSIVTDMLKNNFPMYSGKDCNGNFTIKDGYFFAEGSGKIRHFLRQTGEKYLELMQFRSYMQTNDTKNNPIAFAPANLTSVTAGLEGIGLKAVSNSESAMEISVPEKTKIGCTLAKTSGTSTGARSVCSYDTLLDVLAYQDFDVVISKGYAVMTRTSGKMRTYIFTIASQIAEDTKFTMTQEKNPSSNTGNTSNGSADKKDNENKLASSGPLTTIGYTNLFTFVVIGFACFFGNLA